MTMTADDNAQRRYRINNSINSAEAANRASSTTSKYCKRSSSYGIPSYKQVQHRNDLCRTIAVTSAATSTVLYQRRQQQQTNKITRIARASPPAAFTAIALQKTLVQQQ